MNLTAAMPLFAMSTERMTRVPPMAAMASASAASDGRPLLLGPLGGPPSISLGGGNLILEAAGEGRGVDRSRTPAATL